MASKDKVLKFLEEKYLAKKRFVVNEIFIETTILENQLEAHYEKIEAYLEKEYEKPYVIGIETGGFITYHVKVINDDYHGHKGKIDFSDDLTQLILSKIKILKTKKAAVEYRLKSDYDRIKTSIILDGLSDEFMEAIKRFINFGWTRYWKNWKADGRVK